jgi:hypothetical protein
MTIPVPRFVREWAKLRQNEILANWEQTGRNEPRWTGVLAPLNDSAYFAAVLVDPEAGTVLWPNGVDLAPEPLYEQAKVHPLVAAA